MTSNQYLVRTYWSPDRRHLVTVHVTNEGIVRSQSKLTWDRVDLPGKRAWIPRTQMKAGRTFGFHLSDAAVVVLKECRRLNPDGDRVFQWEERGIDNFHTKAFKKAVAAAKVGPFRWHDLRHTGASWAVQAGVTLPELMAMGDWKSYRMVLRYSHLAPSNTVSAAEKVAQSVAQAPKRAKPKKKRKSS
jgi:integrase